MSDANRSTGGHGAGRLTEHPTLGPHVNALSVTMIFDGQPIEACDGEPIAAALLAAGVRVLRTMPRSGDPRGGYCMIGRCADCAMIVDGEPNVLTCVTLVREGMVVQTQHGLGEVAWGIPEAAK